MTRQGGCSSANEIQIHHIIHSCAILQFLEAESLQHVFFHPCFTLSLTSYKYEDFIVFNSVSRHDDVILMYKDMMNVENVVVIGIRYNRTALRYMRLYSVMSRVVDSPKGKKVQDPSRTSFLF